MARPPKARKPTVLAPGPVAPLNTDLGTPGLTPGVPDPTQATQFEAASAKKKADDELLDTLTKDFRRLQKQKARKTGGVEARILLSCAFDWGEQYIAQSERGITTETQDPNKLYLVFNLIGQFKQRLLGRLNATGLQFGAQPNKKDPKSLGDAEVVDQAIRALDKKLDQPARTWELLDWLAKGGVVFEYTPWIPNATVDAVPQFDAQGNLLWRDTQTGEILPQEARDFALSSGEPPERFEIDEEIATAGEVGSEILSPLNVFLDQTVRSVEDLAPDQRVHIAKIRTRGWIEDTYGEVVDLQDLDYEKELRIVTTTLIQEGDATSSLFLKDMVPTVQGSVQDDDPDMAIVVESYLPVSKQYPHGHFDVFIPGKKILWSDVNPYDEIPLTDIHFTPVTTTFWTKDYITDLIAPQRFLNKRLSQMGEHANSSIYDKILVGGSLRAVDVPTDTPGVIPNAIAENGAPMVQRLPGPQLPSWFLTSIEMVEKFGGQIAGAGSLTENAKFPGQLRGPMAVPMLQEIMDSEWGPLYFHLAQRMARIKQQRINRMKKYYPATRTMHYTDRNQRDEVLEFHAEKILRSGTDFTVSVEQTTVIPELRALREARVRERLQSPLAILYMDERTGHLDKSKIAADLRTGDYGREDRESASRKFAQQLIERLWKGQPCPPVEPYYDHEHMMDELEGEMMTTEFLGASPPIQQLFRARWQEHLQFLQQKAAMQQQAMQSQQVHQAVAQATQQAAAQAAAEAVHEALHATVAQNQSAPGPQQLVNSATQAVMQQHAPGQVGPPGSQLTLMKPPVPQQPSRPNPNPVPQRASGAQPLMPRPANPRKLGG